MHLNDYGVIYILINTDLLLCLTNIMVKTSLVDKARKDLFEVLLEIILLCMLGRYVVVLLD